MPNQLMSAVLCTLLYSSAFAQNYFEQGYIVRDDNDKSLCYIRNNHWKYNPSQFEFRREPNEFTQRGNPSKIKEFQIFGQAKYVSANVQINRSTDNSKKGNWSREQLFLRVVSDGTATLYSYEEPNFTRYFYTLSAPLHKRLLFPSRYPQLPIQVIPDNKQWKAQLAILQTSKLGNKDFDQIGYNENDIKTFFDNYNQKKIRRISQYLDEFINVKFVFGRSLSSFVIIGGIENDQIRFKNAISNKIAVETESYFPFNRNKWSVYFVPTYQRIQLKTNQFVDNSWAYVLSGTPVNFDLLEIPLGFRYRMYLFNGVNLYSNAFYSVNFASKASLHSGSYFSESDLYLSRHTFRFGYGFGLEYRRLCVEYATYSQQDLVNCVRISSKFNTQSVSFKFKLFSWRNDNKRIRTSSSVPEINIEDNPVQGEIIEISPTAK